MDDPILSSYLKEFTEYFHLEGLNESSLFEYFSAYCVYSRDFSEYTDLEDVIVAGGNDSGIDAIGIFINDIFIDSAERKLADEIVRQGDNFDRRNAHQDR